MTIQICERLVTLCGETHLVGVPCALIRCAGCPLHCSWCDTSYARQASGETATVEELVEWVEQTKLGLVLLTGGEPLLQPELPELARRLAVRYKVLVETSGAYDIEVLPPPILRSVDVKCPGSGEAARNRWENLDRLRAGDAVKLVLASREDYEYARSTIERHRLGPPVEVLLSPVSPGLAPEQLARWMLEDRLSGVRLNLQAHRLLWAGIESNPEKTS